MGLLFIDWGAANLMVAITLVLLVAIPIIILIWVFGKHPDEENNIE